MLQRPMSQLTEGGGSMKRRAAELADRLAGVQLVLPHLVALDLQHSSTYNGLSHSAGLISGTMSGANLP
jgi:hypothetical protein